MKVERSTRIPPNTCSPVIRSPKIKKAKHVAMGDSRRKKRLAVEEESTL
jgi:hypothetical protein